MKNIVELQQVTVSHKGIELLKEFNLKIAAGRIVGIIGGPGSGKTTLLQLLSGLIKPAAGKVTIFDKDIYDTPIAEPIKVGYVPSSLGIDEELTVAEIMLVFSTLYQESTSQKGLPLSILKLIGLGFHADIAVGRLTKSQKLFLAIGISLLHNPQLLLIDEPDPYLETGGRLEFLKLLEHITRMGTVVVITTKSTENAGFCDEVALLHNGNLSILGTVAELCQAYDVVCFETLVDGRINDDMLQMLGSAGIVSYMSGQVIRVVNPINRKEELEKYGFYQTKPGIEDVKRLYESVAS